MDAIIIANIWNQDDKLAKTEDTVQKADSLVIPKVLKASNQTGMFANDGTLTHDGQGWIERCTGTCVRILNDHRNDVVSAMGEEWRKHHEEHGKLPEIEDFAKVVTRNLAEMDEE